MICKYIFLVAGHESTCCDLAKKQEEKALQRIYFIAGDVLQEMLQG